ncbi:MAG: efflux RND transporter periplasmic adaptor subunit [Nitrospira sp.]|nr:efflux RND transporter periplasmic adaptor subunit [Nitrospira sp.]
MSLRFVRWLSNVCLVLAGSLLCVTGHARGEAKPEPSSPAVRSELQAMRGIVKAATQAVLFSQIQGRVKRLPFREGARFKKGSSLVQIDCDKYRAELAGAMAEYEAKEKTHRNNLQLATLHAVGQLEVEVSAAEAKKALAAIRIMEINVRGCEITAPFSGRIVEVLVHEYENVFPNDKLLSLLDDTSLEIELVLPSNSLSWLARGGRFVFSVDETGRPYPAVVKELGANVDPASQTIKVTGRFEKLPSEVLAGMSGTASFPVPHP